MTEANDSHLVETPQHLTLPLSLLPAVTGGGTEQPPGPGHASPATAGINPVLARSRTRHIH